MKKSVYIFLNLAILFSAFFFLILIDFYPHKVSEKTLCIECRSNLEKIGIALKAYALDNDLFYPPYDDFNGLKLLAKYIPLYKLKCPLLKNNGNNIGCDYFYRGGYKDNEPLKYICWDRPINHSRASNKDVKITVNVLFTNGYVGTYPVQSWEKMAKDYIVSHTVGEHEVPSAKNE